MATNYSTVTVLRWDNAMHFVVVVVVVVVVKLYFNSPDAQALLPSRCGR